MSAPVEDGEELTRWRRGLTILIFIALGGVFAVAAVGAGLMLALLTGVVR